MTNFEKAIYLLESELPFTVALLDTLLNRNYFNQYIEDNLNSYSIALLKEGQQWIAFSNKKDVVSLVHSIYSYGIDYRIILYGYSTIPNAAVFFNKKGIHCSIEDFMMCKKPHRTNSQYDIVRLATEKDIAMLNVLQRQYLSETVNWPYLLKIPFYSSTQTTQLMLDKKIFVVGNPPTSKLEIIYTYNNYVNIGRIFTQQEYRNRGQMHQLLSYFIDWCCLNRLIPTLNVNSQNPAKRLYSRYGFEKIGEVYYLTNKG